MDEILVKSLFAGIGICISASPVGCFVLWQRMANFGDSLSHSALLAIVFATIFELDMTLSVIVLCSIIASFMTFIKTRQNRKISNSTILSIMSHSSIAISLVVISLSDNIRFNLSTFLFAGDILSVSVQDIIFIYAISASILIWLMLSWKKLIASIISREMAQINGIQTNIQELQFSIALSIIIAIFIKFIGILLIAAMLIIPAASARNLSRNPVEMIIKTTIIGVSSVIIGINSSFYANTPTGPTIIVVALCFFIVSHLKKLPN